MSGVPDHSHATDPLRAVADSLRDRKGVPFKQAKLEADGGDGDWTEFFRGKDLLRYIQANPGKVDAALKDKQGRTDEETAAELVRALLSRGLIQRTERKFKRPKPGRTRLVKWPRTLLLVRDQQWDEDAFYAWKYERPTSMWYYLGIGAIPVVVIAACLFPLAPWWARVALVYVLSGLLVLLMGVLVLRYTVFGIVWVLSGSSLWIFPNLMSDQASITEAFVPAVEFKRCKSLAEAWKTRAVTGCLCGAMLWLLASHSPDMAHLKDDAEKAHDWMVDYLKSMHGRNQTFLADNSTAGPAQQQPGGPGASSRQGPGAARSRGHRPDPNKS